MTDSTRTLLRKLAPSIYGPTILFTLGQAAMLPIIPVLAVELGAGIGLSGVITSAMVVGQVIGNLPSSRVVARLGERGAMLIATAVAALGVIATALAPTLAVLGVGVFVVGLAAATFGLARHSFMTTRVPYTFRARALSLLGGSDRFGRFLGPFLAALLIAVTGLQTAAIWCFLATLGCVALFVALAPDPERVMPVQPVTGAITVPTATVVSAGNAVSAENTGSIWAAVRARHAGLVRVGGSAAILAGMRSSRDVLLPLWGISIGMDATAVALIVGLSGTVDFALFYVSGQVMDRFGRIWAAVPATVIMGCTFLALSLTHDLPQAVGWLIACAVMTGVGNGLSSGILLTLGADLAPRRNPAPYLAAWRTLTDLGGAVLPLVASGIAVFALPAATATVGTLALLGAAGFARWIPRFVPRRNIRRVTRDTEPPADPQGPSETHSAE